MIQTTRVRALTPAPERGDGRYVLYWMQQAQRAEGNHALEWAVRAANRLGVPLVVGFGLMPSYPEANARHFAFLLEGLADVADRLNARGAVFVVRVGEPSGVCARLAGVAALVVCDRGYLRHQIAWRAAVAAAAGCRVVEIESDVVVPVDLVSAKAEYAARTIRPKIHRHLDGYLAPLAETPLAHHATAEALGLGGDIDPRAPAATLARLDIDRTVAPVADRPGGLTAARRRLADFLACGIDGYAAGRVDRATQGRSELGAYLHFGQIGPLEVARAVATGRAGSPNDRAAVLEQLIVRRELAANFVRFSPDGYDRYAAVPAWARATLDAHRADRRPRLYDRATLEVAATDDPYWNAAMTELTHRGRMPNYLRMYWGKKILEWCPDPETAFDWTLAFNNRYFLDGRDVNSYASVGWLFGLHDRPWPERAVFGTVRTMTAAGVKRKFPIDAYVSRVRAEVGG